ncbi:hypothetical protein GCM10008934_08780 [Virgibacillus salarius]
MQDEKVESFFIYFYYLLLRKKLICSYSGNVLLLSSLKNACPSFLKDVFLIINTPTR